MSEKHCGSCSRTLPVTFFARDASRVDGLMNRCLECDRARNRDYYARTGRRSTYKPKSTPRTCKVCGGPATSTRHHYCDACRSAAQRKRNSAPRPPSRGYGWAHHKKRLELEPFVNSGRALCTRCAQPIIPGELWDLDHTDDRVGYRGPAHRRCNRAAGAWKGNRQRALARA